MKFSIKDFFSNCNQIRRKLRIWSHLPKKSLMENFTLCAVNKQSIEAITEVSRLNSNHHFRRGHLDQNKASEAKPKAVSQETQW